MDDREWALVEAEKVPARFKRRERREHFGELVQLDGSFHDWLEGRGPVGCLMTMTDDATGRVYAQISKEETLWAAAKVLRDWTELYGVPRALYTDMKNVYYSRTQKMPLSQFGLMCEKLGIEIIAASSPQAKGRVERTHGTNQDRLIKKLRLKGISSYEEMNLFLREEYLPTHNARFARAPASPSNYHLPKARRQMKACDIWCREEERQLSNDGVISYEKRALQLDLRHDMPVRAKVLVRVSEDGLLRVIYRTRHGAEHELTWRDYKKPAPPPKRVGLSEKAIAAHKARHPGANHPWRNKDYLAVKSAFDQRRAALIPTEVP